MPAFTKHCRLCNACMLSLDHHCLFLTRCVAANNHRSFVLFMIEAMFANLLFARAAVSYLNLQVFIGEVSSLREAMGQDVYVVVLFFINCFGFLYILFLMFFQFKVITDGGTTYYSPDGRALHR
ncbi:PREDICTED: palmitoyltransferase SWF1-like [Acropora digitifera]|nr:PREDICTED: palmitoyltransferase SWF1-like [Acropora digitifera]